MFKDIVDFHEKFEIPKLDKPGFPSNEMMQFRLAFLAEELEEFSMANKANDIEGVFDALIDLVYVALGTAVIMGLPWNEGWKLVHEANMKKIKAQSKEHSKRNNIHDVVKPHGWESPNLSILLENEADNE